MFTFFLPSHIKAAEEFLGLLQKEYKYYHDFLTGKELEKLNEAIAETEGAIQSPQTTAEDVEKLLEKHKSVGFLGVNRSWRETAELLLVVLIVVLGIRSYFLQPFKIPTNSMWPTLHGIISESRMDDSGKGLPLPSIPQRVFDILIHGKTYHRVTAQASGTIDSVHEANYWLTQFTCFTAGGRSYWVWATPNELREVHQEPVVGEPVTAGEDIVNLSVQSGDHVFVNKMSYYFGLPSRGDVIVFTTRGIEGIEESQEERGVNHTQYYIKRCVGLPGDNLRVNPPYLYVNGQIQHGIPFEKIYSRKNGYNGYSNKRLLGDPKFSYTVPQDAVWAMGDNSDNSLDSRFWGGMPTQNLVGSGCFVYWPITARWGFIH